MADRFVSAGTAQEPPERNEEWLAAQRELDEQAAARKKKEAASTAGSGLQEGGKTLYEVLQANKASKQEAFEESAKLKHQFRSLDDDEVEFLDSIMDSTRKKEDEVKKSTAEQLEIFRRQREDAEKAEDATEINENSELWKAAPKKRKRKQEKGPFKGLKLRRKSSTAEDEEKSRTKDVMNLPEPDSRESTKSGPTPTASSEEVPNQLLTTTYTKADSPSAAPTPARPAATLGLDSYSSDEDY